MNDSRNLSMIEYFKRKGLSFEPRLRFKGTTKQDFVDWKKKLLSELKVALGPMSNPVPLNPKIICEIEAEGLIKQRVLLDTEADMSVVALVYIPKEALTTPAPAILCNHGHGQYGKDSVMGVRSGNSPQRNIEIDRLNYDYGLQMAKRGYVTIAIDWRGFGERGDYSETHDAHPYPGRDKCNIHFIRGSLMGINMLALNIFDGIRILDYLMSAAYVDASRIGAMGLSLGGTMTTWLSLLDERIRVADIICYSARFKEFAINRGNTCGSQFFPALYTICDLPDLHGLIAPRPLLAEIGMHDQCFLIDEAMSCRDEVQKIYTAAGAASSYETEIFEGDHRFAGDKAFHFFDRHLKGIQK